MYTSGVATKFSMCIRMALGKMKLLFNCFIFPYMYMYDVGHWVATLDVANVISENSESPGTQLTVSTKMLFPDVPYPDIRKCVEISPFSCSQFF